MRWTWSLLVGLVSAVALALPAAASAKLAAAVTVEPSGSGSRLVVALSSDASLPASKKPTKLAISAKGKSYKLTKAKGKAPAGTLGTWRSAVLKGKSQTAVQGLVGKKVSVKVTSKSGTTTVKAVAGLPAPTGGGSPGPGATPAPGASPTTPGAPAPTGPTSLFGAPAAPLEGQAAANAVLPFLVDSRFTDCVAGWPNCFTAQHFGHFANGDMWYCRLTSAQGADIKSYSSNLTVTGANQAVDGSWAISYAVLSYGAVRNYRWDVTAQGVATGQYWNSESVAPGQQPNEIYTGYQWVRGARDCTF
ncbi:MAG: hypothetical protein JHD16_15585 [Solirubrobacteraceae bacterium]|nr:hypothetical protein [Solirubrobacteraceae bacterium]